jgi:DNA-binding transcriptional ArsR family regulator
MSPERVADLCKVLSSVRRLQILFYLYKKAVSSVGRMEEELGLREANLSQHLRVLRAYKLVKANKLGTFRLYELTPFGRKVVTILERFFKWKGKNF